MAPTIRAEQLAGGVAPPATAGWPPPWRSPDAHARLGGVDYPPAGWPSADQLDYTVKAITAMLLVLALPALLALLLTRPGALLAGLGRRHVA